MRAKEALLSPVGSATHAARGARRAVLQHDVPGHHGSGDPFSPLVVGVGRAVPPAVLAIIVLAARHERICPPRAALPRILVVAATVGVGFGLLSASRCTR